SSLRPSSIAGGHRGKSSWDVLGLNPQYTARRIGEVGLTERVEMELFETARTQPLHLIGENGGGHHAARFEIVVEAVIEARDPFRHRGAGLVRHTGDRLDAR